MKNELITFKDGTLELNVPVSWEQETVWLTRNQMAELFDRDVKTIGKHINNALKEELDNSTVANFATVQMEGGREVERNIEHYNLDMIISVGYRVKSTRGVQFRKWANKIVKDYTIQGWVMDEERLKNGGTLLTKDYFEKQLEKIREIRISERKFYQKITDIYATALDYDPSAKATRRFFAAVQNKLHYSVHGQTASEVIYNRANADKEHMGLQTWDGAPNGKIHRYDVTVAKNYLDENEIHQLERIVSSYLDLAEVQAERHIPMTMSDWEKKLDSFLTVWDREILQDAGKVSAELAKMHALTEFEKYRVVQDRLYRSDFDRMFLEEVDDESLSAEKGGTGDE